MGELVSIAERIEQSRRASAVERAWQVAKSLEGDRSQIEGLQWVEPERDEKQGIRRRIDFSSEFPEGVDPLLPTPLYMSVMAPASLLVPDEDINVAWTMPILTRMTETRGSLDDDVRRAIGMYDSPTVRHTIDAVSFLPFPKADAPAEEQFKPEFMVALGVDADLGKPDNYFAAVARYGGKTVRQMVTGSAPKTVYVFADPKTLTHFSAQMLVNLSAAELAATPENAGELEIFLYRITKGGFSIKDYSAGLEGIGNESSVVPFGGTRESTRYGGDLLGPSLTKGGGGGYRGLTSVPNTGSAPRIPAAQAPKEAGDVKIGEGTKGQRVDYETLDGYVTDKAFGIQPIRIKLIGVREASNVAAKQALTNMAQGYGK